MGDISDVDGRLPPVIGSLNLDGVIEVASCVGIDRDDIATAQILAALKILGGDFPAKMLRLHAHRCREVPWESVLVDHREHVDSGGSGGPEHLDDGSLGIHMAVLPAVESGHDLVADLGATGGRDIEVAGESRIIRDDMMEIFCLLERADDRRTCALDNFDDPSLLPAVTAGTPMVTGLLDETGHDAVAIQRGAEVISRDEEILAALIIGQHVSGAARMDLELPGEEIGGLRKDEVIAADTNDPPLAFQSLEDLIKSPESTFLKA